MLDTGSDTTLIHALISMVFGFRVTMHDGHLALSVSCSIREGHEEERMECSLLKVPNWISMCLANRLQIFKKNG